MRIADSNVNAYSNGDDDTYVEAGANAKSTPDPTASPDTIKQTPRPKKSVNIICHINTTATLREAKDPKASLRNSYDTFRGHTLSPGRKRYLRSRETCQAMGEAAGWVAA